MFNCIPVFFINLEPWLAFCPGKTGFAQPSELTCLNVILTSL